MAFKLFFFFFAILLSTFSISIASKEFELEFSVQKKNLSEMAIALSEILRGIATTRTITLFNAHNRKSNEFNEFIMEIHRLQLETCIFNETKKFFNFIAANLKGSLEVTSLIFHNPEDLIREVKLSVNFAI
jgi:hypothetical protein